MEKLALKNVAAISAKISSIPKSRSRKNQKPPKPPNVIARNQNVLTNTATVWLLEFPVENNVTAAIALITDFDQILLLNLIKVLRSKV